MTTEHDNQLPDPMTIEISGVSVKLIAELMPGFQFQYENADPALIADVAIFHLHQFLQQETFRRLQDLYDAPGDTTEVH